MPSSTSVQDAHEDEYLYTTVAIVASTKPKKQKDTIFCVVFFLVLFCILGEQLQRVSFRQSPLEMTRHIHILPTMKIDAKLTKQYNTVRNKILEMKNGIIPIVISTTMVIDCMTMSDQNSSWRPPLHGWPGLYAKVVDTLPKFENYVSKVNMSFMALQDVKQIYTENMSMTKKIKFLSYPQTIGSDYSNVVITSEKNKIGSWELFVCFLTKGQVNKKQ